MTKEERIKLINHLKYSRSIGADYTLTDEDVDEIIEALEHKPCEDAISRQAVLDYINDDLGLGDEEYGLDAERLVELGKSYKYVKSLPSVTPQSKWIPAYERLPEPNRLVLCDITTGVTETYFLACWNDIQNDWEEGIGGYRLLERDLGYKVIEWQPLPELYRGGRI